jgi:hypothetical protein
MFQIGSFQKMVVRIRTIRRNGKRFPLGCHLSAHAEQMYHVSRVERNGARRIRRSEWFIKRIHFCIAE